MNLKAQIAPKGIEFKPTEFMMSGRYCTILTIVSYPKFIQPGYLANLTNLSGIKIVAKHIPIELSTLQRMINKEIADLKTRYQTEHDKTIQERIRQDYESLEQFISMLVATQSRIFDFQLHVLISAETKDDMENKKMQVRNYIDALGMRGIPLMFEQEKVIKSMIPIFPKQDIEDRVGAPIPSVTIAAMYPFIFDSIKDPGNSTLFGVDFSGGVILFNQFLYQIKKENNRNNANIIILGSSGSGKSTLIKLILKEEEPTSGRIIINGKDTTYLKPKRVPFLRRSMGVVFQDFRLLPDRTVYDNVAYAMYIVRATPKHIRRQVPMVLSLVGLSDKAKVYPNELSGGEQQRVALARALVNNPSMIIADEPTGNLDPDTAWEIMNLLKDINARGTTVVVATHAKDIVDRMKKRVIQIEKGNIIRDDKKGGYNSEV